LHNIGLQDKETTRVGFDKDNTGKIQRSTVVYQIQKNELSSKLRGFQGGGRKSKALPMVTKLNWKLQNTRRPKDGLGAGGNADRVLHLAEVRGKKRSELGEAELKG